MTSIYQDGPDAGVKKSLSAYAQGQIRSIDTNIKSACKSSENNVGCLSQTEDIVSSYLTAHQSTR